MFDEVVVPADGSGRSAVAIKPAARIAVALDCDLRVVSYTDDLLTRAREKELEAQISAARLPGEVRLSIHVEHEARRDFALNSFLDRWPDALLCMATHGRGRSAELFGSAAASVVRGRSGPVLLIGPQYQDDRFNLHGPMVVPLDRSDHAETILPVATRWAQSLSNRIELVQVLDATPTAPYGVGATPEERYDIGYLRRIAHDLAQSLAETPGYDVLHRGHVAQSIVAWADEVEASLVAMSTHGASGLARVLHGSVTADVVRHSKCPVLTMRPTEL